MFYALISFFLKETCIDSSLREKHLRLDASSPKHPWERQCHLKRSPVTPTGRKTAGLGSWRGYSFHFLLFQHRIPNFPQRKQILIIMSRRSWTRGSGFWTMKTKTLCIVLNRSFLALSCLALWSCKCNHVVCAGGSLQAPPEESLGPAYGEPLTILGSR